MTRLSDLYLSAIVQDVVMEGDILEVRPYTIAQPSSRLLRTRCVLLSLSLLNDAH